ncbi:MAG: 2TM domain-containing protein [Leeuwenhoekiella sp.]
MTTFKKPANQKTTNMNNFEKENKYLRAKERVAQIKKFYTGLISYTVFIGLLAVVNYYLNGWHYPWFLWAAFGWGIGLVFQAARAFDWNPFVNKAWEERKIKELMEKEERSSGNMGRWE